MKIEEYISSGILESYVLGGLDPSEVQEVERMASLHPEVRKEITLLQHSFEMYAESIALKPSPSVKNKIMAELRLEGNNELKETKIVSLSYYKYATAASVALMIICGGMATFFWSKWQGAEERLALIEEKTNRYADEIQKANFKIDQLAKDFDAIGDTSVVKVNMKGVALSPGSVAIVFWNKSTSEVFIDPGNLPKAPEGMQYQLWALKDGQPIDAGVFDDNRSGIQKVKSIQGAQAYAVTLEKKGGSPAPTLTSMYVFGGV